eukprot:scaffold80094_cov69-Phaeocystis_antarctica.AAC.3
MTHDFRAHDHTGGVADVQLTPYRSPANALVAFHCANVSFTARSYVSQCIMYPVQHCPASIQCMARSRCATPAWSCRAHASPEYHPSLVITPPGAQLQRGPAERMPQRGVRQGRGHRDAPRLGRRRHAAGVRGLLDRRLPAELPMGRATGHGRRWVAG